MNAGPLVVSRPGAWPMYRAMVGVGLLCGLLIVTVFQTTRPRIERNKAEALQRAIFEVLPGAATSRTYVSADGGGFSPVDPGNSGRGDRGGGDLVYAGYDEAGSLVGLAVEAQGMGYQDVIRLLYGYSFDEEAVIGMKVLESKETPGLGDKIITDADFLANFARLDVALDAAGAGLANPVVAVKHGQKANPWEVDGITGATISSVAIAGILDRSAGHWVPALHGRRADFEEARP